MKFENTEVWGFEHAFRGLRNPKNSWNRSDSGIIWTQENAKTEMEKIRAQWEAAGLELPRLVYWNIESRSQTVLDCGPDVTLCSGASPVLFEQIMQGISGRQLMMNKLMSSRYECIK